MERNWTGVTVWAWDERGMFEGKRMCDGLKELWSWEHSNESMWEGPSSGVTCVN